LKTAPPPVLSSGDLGGSGTLGTLGTFFGVLFVGGATSDGSI
jgi:hypothetical protein